MDTFYVARVEGLKASHPGGQGIYLAGNLTTPEEQKTALLHEALAGFYGNLGHSVVEELQLALEEGTSTKIAAVVARVSGNGYAQGSLWDMDEGERRGAIRDMARRRTRREFLLGFVPTGRLREETVITPGHPVPQAGAVIAPMSRRRFLWLSTVLGITAAIIAACRNAGVTPPSTPVPDTPPPALPTATPAPTVTTAPSISEQEIRAQIQRYVANPVEGFAEFRTFIEKLDDEGFATLLRIVYDEYGPQMDEMMYWLAQVSGEVETAYVSRFGLYTGDEGTPYYPDGQQIAEPRSAPPLLYYLFSYAQLESIPLSFGQTTTSSSL